MINYFKYGIFFTPHIHGRLGRDIIDILKVKKIRLNDRYLGGPLFTNKSKIQCFDNLAVNMGNMLKGWKGESMSPPDREVMAKSVLESLPVYSVSTFIPKTTIIDSRVSLEISGGENLVLRKAL